MLYSFLTFLTLNMNIDRYWIQIFPKQTELVLSCYILTGEGQQAKVWREVRGVSVNLSDVYLVPIKMSVSPVTASNCLDNQRLFFVLNKYFLRHSQPWPRPSLKSNIANCLFILLKNLNIFLCGPGSLGLRRKSSISWKFLDPGHWSMVPTSQVTIQKFQQRL